MEMHAIKKLSDAELQQHLRSAQVELKEARFQVSSLQLKNVRLVRTLRTQIARLQTEIHSRASQPTTN